MGEGKVNLNILSSSPSHHDSYLSHSRNLPSGPSMGELEFGLVKCAIDVVKNTEGGEG